MLRIFFSYCFRSIISLFDELTLINILKGCKSPYYRSESVARRNNVLPRKGFEFFYLLCI